MKLQKRDLVTALLFLALIGTNWVWYQNSQAHEFSHQSLAETLSEQQDQINSLSICINENIWPCALSVPSIH